jgi:hypothetical protein
MQAFNALWNTPDPCMKKKLLDKYNDKVVSGIGLFSLASLVPGPWNLTGNASDTLVEDTLGPASKVAGFNAAKNAAPPAAARAVSVGGKVVGYAASIATLWATYENILAFVSSDTSNCGCNGK